jgi:hypothetical protein
VHMPKLAALLCLLCLPTIQGCHVSGGSVSTSVSVNDQTGAVTTTVSGTLNIAPDMTYSGLAVADLSDIPSSGYVVSLSVPSGSFVPDQNNTPTTTLTATTDTGYTSSITVVLQPTSPAINPINSGDIVYSYSLPNTSQVNDWIQQVALNTSSTTTLSSSAGLPVVAVGNPGTYNIAVEITSAQVGSVELGASNISIQSPTPPPSCDPGENCVTQPAPGPN